MTQQPAGWYPDPEMPGTNRFWDGQRFTGVRAAAEHVSEDAPSAPSVAATEAYRRVEAARTEVLEQGSIDGKIRLTIYRNGTFTTKPVFGRESEPDRLLGFDHDIDSMRRKSVTGRSAAAVLTGGASLLASNNRGVVYVTVTGEKSGVRTFTTRNPDGHVLSSIRSLKAAVDALLESSGASASPSTASAPSGSFAEQLKQLAELHAAGALSDAEFTAAKQRLLG